MKKILLIGSDSHKTVDNIKWTQPFRDFEKYSTIILDLSTFPKDYPPFLFENIGVLKRTSRLFIRDNKEIFCIMEKPFKILFKKIPLNYSWIPFPQKLKVNPMLYGKTIIIKDECFSEFFENVNKWDNELFWKKTANCTFTSIAINKSKNSIAATISMGGRGKIHFLPKANKISSLRTIELLLDFINEKEQKNCYSEKLGLSQSEEIEKNNDIHPEISKKLFSTDMEVFKNAVYILLGDLGISKFERIDFEPLNLNNGILVETIDGKGKIEYQNPKIKILARIIEKLEDKRKILVIANTYKELPFYKRKNKEHLDIATRLFFETSNTLFLTTLSLYNLWKKVKAGSVSVHEAFTLIKNQNGVLQI